MHKLLREPPGSRMLMLGNEAIARGAIEAGVAVAATYPGTPSSEISASLSEISRETDLYFEYSTNEKVALEVAAAAANCGLRSMAIMKHVGLNVAADALMTLAYVGVRGGLVVLSADDPAMFSSQNEQDNRLYARLAGLPMLEPSSVAEAARMTREAFALSEALGEPVLLRTTTRINHSTAAVTLGEVAPRKTLGAFARDPSRYVTVPAVSRRLHARLLQNLSAAAERAERSEFNFVAGRGDWGVITSGVSQLYVSDALRDLDLQERIKVLRIGFSHPLPERMIKDFLIACRRVLVVEEGEPYLEEAVKAMAQEAGLSLPIAGKGEDLFSRLYEFDPGLVRRVVARYFDIPCPPAPTAGIGDLPELPQRPPNLCAGCSHRATFLAVKQATAGSDTVFPTDIGCYTLGFLPPLSMGDFLICMGSSLGTACGFSRATGQRVVAFIGDSTFFHSGLPGLINAVFNRHRLTLVILDNGTTAMTGHQPNPGVDTDAPGNEGHARVEIEALVRAAGVAHVRVIQPFALRRSVAAIQEALACEGVSVVISRAVCALYARGLKRLAVRPFRVSERCRNHRHCISSLACPAFRIRDGRVDIDPQLCVGCTLCAQVCPEHAIVPLKQEAP
jgi:indolepyruvate ferredoxin oxidoreductase alpha subunit